MGKPRQVCTAVDLEAQESDGREILLHFRLACWLRRMVDILNCSCMPHSMLVRPCIWAPTPTTRITLSASWRPCSPVRSLVSLRVVSVREKGQGYIVKTVRTETHESACRIGGHARK